MQEAENQAIENNEVIVEEPVNNNESVEEVIDKGEPEEPDIAEDSDEEKDEQKDNADDSSDELGDEPFPKKATRALERRNKKINKLRAESAELKRELAEYRSQPQPSEQIDNAPQPGGLNEPQEEEFEDYADFLEAKGEYKANKKFADKEAQAQYQQTVESRTQWVQERAKYVDDRAAEAVKTIPELDGLYQENQDIVEGYSDTTKMAFLEAEKPELAFYALATEGKLEELDQLSPTRVARAIALAEIRGEGLSKKRPVSNAPAPIKRPRGSSPQPRALDDMSPTELLNHLKKTRKR